MSYALRQTGVGTCCLSCERGGPCTGCGATPALGAIVGQGECQRKGGDWDPVRQECRNLIPNQCRERGGVWDDAAQICRGVPAIPEEPVDELCAKRGGEYDYRLRLCYKPESGGGRRPITLSSAGASRVPLIVAAAVAAGALWWWRTKR